MSSEVEDRADVLEWFTAGRRIPELIGKLPSGERIKGGPYRPVQLLLGGLVLIVGHLTMRWWGGWGIWPDGLVGTGVRYICVAAAAAATCVGAGQIPLSMINPLVVVGGGMSQLTRRTSLTRAGEPIPHPPTAHVAAGAVHVQDLDLLDPEPSGAPAETPPAPAPPRATHPASAQAMARMSSLLTKEH